MRWHDPINSLLEPGWLCFSGDESWLCNKEQEAHSCWTINNTAATGRRAQTLSRASTTSLLGDHQEPTQTVPTPTADIRPSRGWITHEARTATCAVQRGIPLLELLCAVGWSHSTTFTNHYWRVDQPIQRPEDLQGLRSEMPYSLHCGYVFFRFFSISFN